MNAGDTAEFELSSLIPVSASLTVMTGADSKSEEHLALSLTKWNVGDILVKVKNNKLKRKRFGLLEYTTAPNLTSSSLEPIVTLPYASSYFLLATTHSYVYTTHLIQ